MDSAKRIRAKATLRQQGLELRIHDIDRSRGACAIARKRHSEDGLPFGSPDHALSFALRQPYALARLSRGENADPYFWIMERLDAAASGCIDYADFLARCDGDLAMAEAEMAGLHDVEFADVADHVRNPGHRDPDRVTQWVRAELGMPSQVALAFA